MPRDFYATDSADKYGAACACGGTIIGIHIAIDTEDPALSRIGSKCYGCGHSASRYIDLGTLPQDVPSAFAIYTGAK